MDNQEEEDDKICETEGPQFTIEGIYLLEEEAERRHFETKMDYFSRKEVVKDYCDEENQD